MLPSLAASRLPVQACTDLGPAPADLRAALLAYRLAAIARDERSVPYRRAAPPRLRR